MRAGAGESYNLRGEAELNHQPHPPIFPCHNKKKMTDNTEQFPIWRVTETGQSIDTDVVVRELPATIILNNKEVATLLCSPHHLDYLAVGFLASEGLINSIKL